MAYAAYTNRRRYHDLDALRSILMIWGIAVHASTLQAAPWLHVVADISGLVRMEAFFVISGLLSALLVERYGGPDMLRKRLLSLGLPFISGLVLLNPVCNYLIYCYHNGTIPLRAYLSGHVLEASRGPMVWHLHLWFLIALMFYAVTTPRLLRGLKWLLEKRSIDIERATPNSLFLALCAVVPVLCLLTRVVFEYLVEPYATQAILFVARSTLFYLPYFTLGLALFCKPRLLESFAQVRPLHLLAASVLLLLSKHYFAALPKASAEALRLLAESYLSIVLASAFFHFARRFFSHESRRILYFSDAAYSIYLLHFLVIYAVALLLRPLLGGGELLAIVAMLATFGITLALHHCVIKRVPTLRFLFNGHLKSRATLDQPKSGVAAAPANAVQPVVQVSR